MSRTPRTLAPGSTLARGYQVVEHLSRGRALDVYDVWSTERECRCVAKVLRPDRLRDASARRRLEREGRLLRRLTHPHVVRGYDLLLAPRVAVIMETLTGETLAHLLERGAERLRPAEIGQLGLQLCSAIGYLHRHGVLHLDLKPSNIVAEAGRAKLIDLSVARPPGPGPAGVGTWCYMAPEQARDGTLEPAADVWGIGVVLWEAATGRPAFGGDEDEAGASATDTESELTPDRYPQLLRRARPVRAHRRLPPGLARAIDTALRPTPAERPTVPELAASLAQVSGVVSPRSPRPAS